jgi:hypothetical protein
MPEQYAPQPQYFDVNGAVSAPTRPPFWRTPKFLAGIGLAVLALLLTIFLVNFFTQGVRKLSTEQASSLADRLAACEGEDDPAACVERVRAEAAKSSGSVEACRGLTDDEYASCAALAARQSGSTSACKELTGGVKTHCEDLAYYTIAVRDSVLVQCDRITEGNLAAACTARVIADAVASGDCEAAGVPVSECDAAGALRLAIAAGTDEACAQLRTEDAQIDCQNGIASVDDDDDGLVLRDEVALGLSDQEPFSYGYGLLEG